jgi:hypothetical protein
VDGAALAPHIDVHVMKPPPDKPTTIPLPGTPKAQPDPEKAIESWEGEGGKVAPAEDARVESAHSRKAKEGRSRSA